MLAFVADHARALGIPQTVRACLFDMDGVLTDTASVHQAAWADMFDEYLGRRDGSGYQPFTQLDYNTYVDGKPRADGTRDFLASRGIVLPEGTTQDAPGLATVSGLSARKNELVLQHLAADGVEVYPGSVRYLQAVRGAGLRTAVVSASENTAAVLERAGLTDQLDVRVDGQYAKAHGVAGKPAPDTYLAAATELGVGADAACVYEDAIAGVAAGHSGGFAYVVGVDRVDHADALRAAGADTVVSDLAELMGSG